MTSIVEPFVLDAALRSELDLWLQKFPADKRRSGVLYALLRVQEVAGGWLQRAHLEAVAEYLGIAPIEVYEVATFYSLYDLKPVGKHKIYFCDSISCFLRGCDELIAHAKQQLGIDWDEVSADGLFTLKKASCLAACGKAPVLLMDKTYEGEMTPEKFDALVAHCRAEKGP